MDPSSHEDSWYLPPQRERQDRLQTPCLGKCQLSAGIFGCQKSLLLQINETKTLRDYSEHGNWAFGLPDKSSIFIHSFIHTKGYHNVLPSPWGHLAGRHFVPLHGTEEKDLPFDLQRTALNHAGIALVKICSCMGKDTHPRTGGGQTPLLPADS